MRIVLIITFLAVLSFLCLVFMASLPAWCAHPEGSGNWIIQSLCK